jgi:hypothetical protein
MPLPQITNPFGVNGQSVNGNIGNIPYVTNLTWSIAGDPVGSIPATTTISSISAASAAVVTTSAAHGLIAGARVTISGVTGTGGTVPNGTYTATPTSATAFTIPVNTTGATLTTSSATVVAPFLIGQVVALQGWNGTQSSAASAPYYPTVGLNPASGSAVSVGVVIGGNTPGSAPVIGGSLLVMVDGICQVYLDGNATAGQNLIASTSRPGAAKGGTAASSLNIGSYIGGTNYTASGQGSLQYAYIHGS